MPTSGPVDSVLAPPFPLLGGGRPAWGEGREGRLGMDGASALSDEELLLQVQRGDVWALELLVQRYWRRVRGLAFRLVQNWETAEDLAQETFVRLLKAVDRYRHPEPVWPWLATITRNLCRDAGRRARRQHEVQAGAAGWKPAPWAADPGELVADRAERDRVVEALRRLSPKHQQVLTLRFYEQLSLREIAGRCGVPLGTVKSRLAWGLRRLRALLGGPVAGKEEAPGPLA